MSLLCLWALLVSGYQSLQDSVSVTVTVTVTLSLSTLRMLLRGASGLFFAMNLMLAAVFSSHRHFAHTTDHQESALQEDSLDRKHHGHRPP